MADHHLVALVVALAALAAVVGCSSADEADAGGGRIDLAATTTVEGPSPDVAPGPDPCEALASTLLRPVGAPAPDDDTALGDALAVLAADGPVEAAAAAATVLDLIAIVIDGAPPEMSDEELNRMVVEGHRAAERVHAWGLDTCPVDGVAWACPETTARPLLPSDLREGGEVDPPDGGPGAATPEEVIGIEAETVDEPVEIRRSADEVVVAWLDDDGHAFEAMTVVDEDGWRLLGVEACDRIADAWPAATGG